MFKREREKSYRVFFVVFLQLALVIRCKKEGFSFLQEGYYEKSILF